MDLVRHILIETEKADEPLDIDVLTREPHWTENVVGYHLNLMMHHKLLDCTVTRDSGGDVVGATVEGLTWDGCDYLDAIRDAGVWAKTKSVIKNTVGSTTLDVIRQTAVMVATSTIKAHLGIT